MSLSRFFIDRPIFAGVISAVIFLAGLIAIPRLPISEYPEVVPPSVQVTAQFPGADPATVADTVATPLEEQINGVENMLYMSSQAASDGTLTLTVTFKLGTDPNLAQELVQNRVNQALPRLALVVLVVILFLQTWRASIIPLLAVPTSIVGTFAAMYLFGFSINALSLFGLVLAIGIVVDDAIVVVENVERNIEAGLSPRAATLQAMSEFTGPIIAIALALCAVFVPIAFISGLTGQFYRQFALTIAFSTVISAFNSLTLSPALSALLLKGQGEPKDILTRLMERVLGPFFRRFNRLFQAGSKNYSRGVGNILSHSSGRLRFMDSCWRQPSSSSMSYRRDSCRCKTSNTL
jgi:multidrug efflux pump subunit AcrB